MIRDSYELDMQVAGQTPKAYIKYGKNERGPLYHQGPIHHISTFILPESENRLLNEEIKFFNEY